jgi:hypothetical protein
LNDVTNSPAALCLLCSRDERRKEAGLLIRELAKSSDSLEETFIKTMRERGIEELTAKAFWYSYEALTKRWGTKETEFTMHSTFSSTQKQTFLSFPVVFSLHVPRA